MMRKQTSSTLYVFSWLFIAMLPNKPNGWNRLVCNTKLSLGYQNYRQKCLVRRTFCFLFWGKYWTKVLRILTKCREVCTNKTKGRVTFSYYCYSQLLCMLWLAISIYIIWLTKIWSSFCCQNVFWVLCAWPISFKGENLVHNLLYGTQTWKVL